MDWKLVIGLMAAAQTVPAAAALPGKGPAGWNLAPRIPPAAGADIDPRRWSDPALGAFSKAFFFRTYTDGRSDRDRKRRVSVRAGDHMVSLGLGRGWNRQTGGSSADRGSLSQSSFGYAELGYNLTLGTKDDLLVGGSFSSERRDLGLASNQYRPLVSNTASLTLGWQHDRAWRVDGGWFAVTSSHRSDLSGHGLVVGAGARVPESGPGLTMSYAPPSEAGTNSVKLALNLGAMALSGADAANLPASVRHDDRASLSLAVKFK